MSIAEVLRQFERRLVQPDYTQLLTLYFGVLLFVIATRWTGIDASMNDSWFGVAPARLVGIALLAFGYGAAFSERPWSQRLAAAGTVVLAAVVTYPLELASHAASHPATPVWWGLTVPLLDGVAYFGLGVVVGRIAALLRLRSILPLLVPAALVGMIWVDVRLGFGLVNPLTTATTVAPAHLVLAAVVAAATVVALLRPWVIATEEAST